MNISISPASYGFQGGYRAAAHSDDYELVTYRMMQKLHAQNVLHAECTFRRRGAVARPGVCPAVRRSERGAARANATSHVAVLESRCRPHFGVDEARRVVEEAMRLKEQQRRRDRYRGRRTRASPEQFREVYEHAAAHGLRLRSMPARRPDRSQSGQRARVEGRSHWSWPARDRRS